MLRSWPCLFLFAVAMTGTGLCVQAQSNDSFAGRLQLTGTAPVAVSNNLRATREAGEPNHAGAAAGRSLWYTWTAPATGMVNLGTYYTGSGAPTLRAVAVYTGNSLASLSEVTSSNNQAQALYVAGAYTSPLLAGGTSINVPVTAGTAYQIAVDAVTPPTTVDDDGTVVLTINAPPTILSAADAVGTVGTSFAYAVMATGGAGTYSATGLPSGLIFNPATGQITGTPTTAGTSTVSLSATGPGGTGTAVLTLLINNASAPPATAPTITSAASARAFVGATFAYTITASGSPTNFTATGLPAGLSLNTTSGLISGTPTISGTFSVPVSATNTAGTGNAVLTVAVSTTPPAPIITSALAASGTVGSSFSYYFTTNVDGIAGAAPTAWTAANLPPGLGRGTNYLAGTPTQAGTYAVPITVTNAGGARTATVTITILPKGTTPNTVAPAAPTLGSAAGAQGVVGEAFSYTLTASNAPTGFAVGSLPAGLSLNANTGVISGTPSVAGTFAIPVTAANAYGTAAGTLTLAIYASPTAQAAANGAAVPVLVSPAAAGGQVGTAFSYPIMAAFQGNYTVTGGGTWTFAAAGLPPGLSLTTSTSSSGYGTISGTPTAAGTYTATISATSPAVTSGYTARPAATGTATVTFCIVPATPTPPLITSAAAVSGVVGGSVSYAVTASGSPTSYAASGLPPGLSIDPTAGTVAGTPMAAGTYQAVLTATNAVGTGSATVTFCIVARPPVFICPASDWAKVGVSHYYTVTVDSTPATYSLDPASLPPGMNFDGSGTTVAQISGTPTTSGIYTIPISATNASGTTRMTLTFTVRPTLVTPIITASARMTGSVGSAFYNSLAVNTAATSYSASNLPPGVTLDPTSGVFGGTPTVAGTYPVSVSATNSVGTGTATVTMIIAGGTAPWLGNSAAITAPRGQYLGGGVTVLTQDPTTINYSGLPPGLFATPVSGNPGAFGGTPNTVGVYPVKVTATSAGGTTQVTITITITNGTASGAPVLSNTLAVEQFTNVGSSTSLTLSTSPAATSYTASSLPPGLTLNSATGVIAGTPTTAGMYPVTVTATNNAGSASAVTNYLVQPATGSLPALNIQATVIAYAGVTHDNGNLYHGLPSETYAASGLPPGLSLNTATGEITGTPTAAGQSTVNVSVTNAAGTTAAVWTYLVKDPSALAPFFYSEAAERAASYGGTLTVSSTPAAIDVNLGTYSDNTVNGTPPPLTFSVTGLPAGATYTATGTTLTINGGTPPVGTYPMTLTAANPAGISASEQILLVVNGAYPPLITSAAAAAGPANVAFSYSVTTNSYAITSYSTGPLPAGLSLNPATGSISGTPTVPGTYTVPVTANAPYTPGTAVLTFRIDPPLYQGLPVITSAAAVSCQDFPPDSASLTSFLSPAASYTFAALNLPTSFAVGNVPAGMLFNPFTNVLSGSPAACGVYQLPVSATNAAGTFNTTLTVVANSPRVSAQPALAYSGYVGGSFSIGVPIYFPSFVSSYASGYGYSTTLDPVVYSAVGLPAGLSMNSYTGQITGIPTQAGTYPVTLTASNRGGSGSAVTTFAITATAPPAAAAPVWSGKAEAAGFLGVPISYTLTATTATSYAATGLPAGLSLNPSSGVISGTPTMTGTSLVTVSASNSAGTTPASLTVTIEAAPFTPVVSSAAAAAATVGSVFSYNLTSTNFSGLPASTGYSAAVSTLPTGLSLDPFTGIISGTPAGPAGTYSVPIAVADGPATVANAWLTLSVQPAPTTPVVSSAAGALGLVANPFSYSIRNTAFQPDASSLPAGLVYDAANGLISGYPQGTGTYSIPLTVPAAGGGAPPSALTIQVLTPQYSLPRLTAQPVGGTAMEGSSFTFNGAAVGVPSPMFQWSRNGVALAGASGPSFTLGSLQTTDSSSYVLTASNAAGSVMSAPATLLVQTVYANWQADHFTASEISAGLADPLSSFSDDGVPNLVKYALDLDPRSPATGAALATLSPPAAGGGMGISFVRDASRSDIDYLVEASTDLHAWTTIAESDIGAAFGNVNAASVVETAVAGTSQSQVAVTALSPAGGTQFLRVRIVRP